MQMAEPGLRSALQAGQAWDSSKGISAGGTGIARMAGVATAARAGVRAAGARAAWGLEGMERTAPHLHLAFLPANSGFQGYCLPQELQENIAPPAMVDLRMN